MVPARGRCPARRARKHPQVLTAPRTRVEGRNLVTVARARRGRKRGPNGDTDHPSAAAPDVRLGVRAGRPPIPFCAGVLTRRCAWSKGRAGIGNRHTVSCGVAGPSRKRRRYFVRHSVLATVGGGWSCSNVGATARTAIKRGGASSGSADQSGRLDGLPDPASPRDRARYRQCGLYLDPRGQAAAGEAGARPEARARVGARHARPLAPVFELGHRAYGPAVYGPLAGDIRTRPDPGSRRPLPPGQGDLRDTREFGGRGGALQRG